MPKGIFTRPSKKAFTPIGPSISYLPLTRGMFALIDADKARFLEQWNWKASWSRRSKNYYADRNYWVGPRGSRKCLSIKLHRLVYGASPIQVDHKNMNTLDCRESNLREANNSENCCNKKKSAANTSGFKGVYWHKQSQRWRASIKIAGQPVHLGNFLSAESAYAAYCAKAVALHGEFARLA